MALKVGEKAPDFELFDDEGERVRLRDFAGRKVVLYFYPKDMTPGCTAEACDFRDASPSLLDLNAVVLGVSRDDLDRHQRFKAKHALSFPLLSDPEARVMRAYGAFGEKVLYGKKSVGPIRTTVLIDEQGRVARIWSKVKVAGHAAQVLEAVRQLASQPGARAPRRPRADAEPLGARPSRSR